MKDDQGLMAALDQEPWLTLSVWADRYADSDDTAREAVLRWIVQEKRAPLYRHYKARNKHKSRETWEWRWLFKKYESERRAFYITQHVLWRWSPVQQAGSVKKTFKSASEAYKYAVDYLSENLDLIK